MQLVWLFITLHAIALNRLGSAALPVSTTKAHLNDFEVLSIYKCSIYDASCKMTGKAKIMSLCQIKILDQLQSLRHSKALQVNVMAFDSIGIFYMSSFWLTQHSQKNK